MVQFIQDNIFFVVLDPRIIKTEIYIKIYHYILFEVNWLLPPPE